MYRSTTLWVCANNKSLRHDIFYYYYIIPCIAVVQTNDEGNLICMVSNREAYNIML